MATTKPEQQIPDAELAAAEGLQQSEQSPVSATEASWEGYKDMVENWHENVYGTSVEGAPATETLEEMRAGGKENTVDAAAEAAPDGKGDAERVSEQNGAEVPEGNGVDENAPAGEHEGDEGPGKNGEATTTHEEDEAEESEEPEETEADHEDNEISEENKEELAKKEQEIEEKKKELEEAEDALDTAREVLAERKKKGDTREASIAMTKLRERRKEVDDLEYELDCLEVERKKLSGENAAESEQTEAVAESVEEVGEEDSEQVKEAAEEDEMYKDPKERQEVADVREPLQVRERKNPTELSPRLIDNLEKLSDKALAAELNRANEFLNIATERLTTLQESIEVNDQAVKRLDEMLVSQGEIINALDDPALKEKAEEIKDFLEESKKKQERALEEFKERSRMVEEAIGAVEEYKSEIERIQAEREEEKEQEKQEKAEGLQFDAMMEMMMEMFELTKEQQEAAREKGPMSFIELLLYVLSLGGVELRSEEK